MNLPYSSSSFSIPLQEPGHDPQKYQRYMAHPQRQRQRGEMEIFEEQFAEAAEAIEHAGEFKIQIPKWVIPVVGVSLLGVWLWKRP